MTRTFEFHPKELSADQEVIRKLLKVIGAGTDGV